MGAIIGFALGYAFGTKAGDRGYEELLESWRVISTSDEVRDMIAGGISVARDLVLAGRGISAERLQPAPGGLYRAA